MWWLIVSLAIFLCFLLFLYHIYGSYTQREWYVTALTLVGWAFCFSIILLLPNDVSISNSQNCQTQNCTLPKGALSQHAQKILWETLYWGTLILTTIYPLVQSYVVAGEFTVKDKLKTAIYQNVILYLVAGVISGILLLIIAIEKGFEWSQLPSIAIAMGNAYGLLLLVILLGVGLIEIPRSLWRRVNREKYLRLLYFKIVSRHNAKGDAKEDYEKYVQLLYKADQMMDQDDPLRVHLQTIFNCLPPEQDKMLGNGVPKLTYKWLADLHAQIKSSFFIKERNIVLYNQTLEEVLYLEDIIESKNNPKWEIVRRLGPENGSSSSKSFFVTLKDKSIFFWNVYVYSFLMIVLCGVSWVLSANIMWSEFSGVLRVFMDNPPDLSVPGITINALFNVNNILVEFIVLVSLTYLSICSLSTLWKLKIFNYYQIVPHHLTDSNSLLFSAAYSCRLVTPLAFNFLLLIIDNKNTVFFEVMGTMDIVPLLGETFSKLVPVLVPVVSIITFLNVYERLLSALHIKYFIYTEAIGEEQVEEGRLLVQRERNNMLRGQRQRIKLRGQHSNSRRVSSENVRTNLNEESTLNNTQPALSLMQRISAWLTSGPRYTSVPTEEGQFSQEL
eukprot:TRINITY_DN3770_c0_g1_i1.p1 TRINITY_DN3770_c0_g1~~TRINITY_DN3770_c0_g1_i1.p1  ORF type:complete len:615 (-),score=88.19 TRINITY_DN3770_c0_g1_i1:49-1893(-)